MSEASFTRLGDLLPRVLEHFNVAKTVSAAQVVTRWPTVAQTILKLKDPTQAKACHVKNGVLAIEVTSSALAQAIQLAKRDLLRELNSVYDSPRVKEIRCVQRG